MKLYFGYVRVSTVKQGEHGVSLQEQKAAIEGYANRNELKIINWFTETETAAKRGRPVFSRMLEELQKGVAQGVIIHKIDRSARNLKDWADLGELIDYGIEVHFANESLDLHTRGGRLSADIQAVVAADYIRNLREETKKGLYGRLKQGIYPLPAPLGYLDQGKGNPKILDPKTAPLVKKAFELYGTGAYSLPDLSKELYRLGLRNKRGGWVTKTGLSTIFNNPFYIGLMRIKQTKTVYEGKHEALVSKALYDRVQAVLQGKHNPKKHKHLFTFRRFLACRLCGYSMIGEWQKGNAYYRCHTRGCPTTTVREDRIHDAVHRVLSEIQFEDEEVRYLEERLSTFRQNRYEEHERATRALQIRLGQLNERINRLTDAYIDRIIDAELFEQKKNAYLLEKKQLEENLANIGANPEAIPDKIQKFLELAKSVCLTYKLAIPEEKRDLLEEVTSNRWVERKNVVVELRSPFREVVERSKSIYGAPQRDGPRTFCKKELEKLFQKLWEYFINH